jgi:hypothetical protein
MNAFCLCHRPKRDETLHFFTQNARTWHKRLFCKKMRRDGGRVAKQLQLKGRTYWILSEPEGTGWKASVHEVNDDGSQEAVGLDASAETRTAADEAVERKLRRMLRAY